MLVYKIDVLKELGNKGITAYYLRKNKVIGEAQIQTIRDKKMCSKDTLDKLCELLEVQPGYIIGYAPNNITEENNLKQH